MSNLVEKPPHFECRGGIVHVVDEYGDRAMPLSVFVQSATEAFALAHQWLAEANQTPRVRRLAKVKVSERRH